MKLLSRSTVLTLLATPILINCSGPEFSPRALDEQSSGNIDSDGSNPIDGDNNTNPGGSTNTGDGDTSTGGGGNTGDGDFDPGPQFVKKSKTIEVKASGDVDILFVVDNSGSMAEEQTELSNRIAGFMDLVQDLNWRVALTTTDPRSDYAWGDGQFRAFDGANKMFLNSETDTLTAAQNFLANAINVGISGSGTERGIHATYRSLERIQSGDYHSDFFRDNASLAVILISDENECSDGSCLTSLPTSRPEELISMVHNTFGVEKNFNFNSIIGIPGDTSCTTVYNRGGVYQDIANTTGGVTASICAPSYTSLLQDIGERVIDLVDSTTLSCPPADVDGDGKADLLVTLASGDLLLLSDFVINGTNVSFNQPLPEGIHNVTYYCGFDGGGTQL